MIQTELNGCFGLLKIIKIIWRKSTYMSMYVIKFENDKRCLYCCKYHAFITEDLQAKKITELKSGDVIWIDISAFISDGSFK